jgi:hypothetical protein
VQPELDWPATNDQDKGSFACLGTKFDDTLLADAFFILGLMVNGRFSEFLAKPFRILIFLADVRCTGTITLSEASWA